MGATGAGARGPGAQSLGRGRRVLRPSEFKAAFEQGRKWVGRHMILFVRDRGEGGLRLGVVTGRKVGCAVVRNRARRRMREAFRRRADWSRPADMLLVARHGSDSVPWDAFCADLETLLRRAGPS